MAAAIEIVAAEFPRDHARVVSLFREYADSLGVNLDFQDFESELATLPGKYATPSGRLLIARREFEPIGCVALRPIDAKNCEMKRLYVRHELRGIQLGRRLVERICLEAHAIGYSRICLDTLPTMVAAQKLYQSLGFNPVEPYVFNPIAGSQFLALDLK